MKYVNAPVMKKDAMALVTGKPVYMDDVAPKDCLIVKVLRSPHAHALIEEINITNALKQKGIECILTYKDVPHRRFTMAGQTFPEPSPYDRYILDQRVRFVGDAVAIVAGEDEAAVDRALKLIKVKYQVLEPVLDYHTAKDNPVLVHPEEDWKALCPVGADNKRNLCASGMDSDGDVDGVMKDCDIVMEGTYHVKAMQQSMMETFRTATYLDTYGRINILSEKNPCECPGHSKIKSPRHKAQNRRRFWSKTDRGSRGISGNCDDENRKTCQNHLYQGRIPNCIVSAA